MKFNKTQKPLWLIGTLLSMTFFPACTSTLVLNTTEELAQQVGSLNQQLSVYQKALEADEAKRIKRLANKRAMIGSLEPSLNERFVIWELSNRKDAIRLYKGIQELTKKRLKIESELDGKFEVERKQLKETQEQYKSQQKALASLTQQLHELGKPQNREEQLKFLVEFAGETRKSLRNLQNEEVSKK